MNTHNIRNELCSTIKLSAHIANAIATAPSKMTESERDDTNLAFGVKYNNKSFADNISRLPDEMMQVYIQLSGGHIHAIYRLLINEDANPSIQALSRTAIDSSAYTFWIAEPEDAISRVSRAVELVHPRLKSMEERGVDKAVIGRWKSSFRKVKNSPKFKKLEPSQDKIREKLFNGDFDWKEFNPLHSYIHADPSIAMSDFLVQSFKPETLKNTDLHAAFFATSLMLKSAKCVARHRNIGTYLSKKLFEVSDLVEHSTERL